jgi:hypothetical protein
MMSNQKFENKCHSITQITDTSLPKGIFLYSELCSFKELFKEIPESLIVFDQKNHILMETFTSDAVAFRQHHPVLKKFGNIDRLTSEIRCALNKLSNDNIDCIVKDICEIERITDADVIVELASQIMGKVSTDKQFIEVYAKACCKLQNFVKCEQEPVTIISKIKEKCKRAFDSYVKIGNLSSINDKFVPTVEDKLLLDSDEVLDKTKILYMIQFIGHLYNLKIFRISSIDYCFKQLFNNIFNLLFCVDAITYLMKVVEETYENENKKQLDEYMNFLNRMKSDEKLVKRDQILLMNIVESYKNKIEKKK